MKPFRPFARAFQTWRAFRRFAGLTDNQREILKAKLAIFEDGASTTSGITVDQDRGLEQDTVYTAIKRISDTIAQTPLLIYERLERGRRRAREHPLWPILNLKANRDMTAFTWKHVSTVHVLGWGNAFSKITRNGAGRIVGLEPLHPGAVKIAGRDARGGLVYEWVNKDQRTFQFPEDQILHLRGISWDGINGISPIMQLRELVGRAKAREEFQSRFYSNGATIGGVITTPEELSDEQLARHKESFEKLYKGRQNAHKVLLLEGAEKFEPLGINPRDAEFVATGKLDAAKIAAAFGVPLQLINDLETGASRASAEQLFREFLILSLQNWFVNIEQQIAVSLLSDRERETLFVEFLREALVQADTQTMTEALKAQVLTAIMTPNEAREKLNLMALEGGDQLLAPVNMMPIEDLGAPRAASFREDGPIESVQITPGSISNGQIRDGAIQTRGSRLGRRRAVKAALALFGDAFERIGRRERQDILRQAKKFLQRDTADLARFLEDYYAENAEFARFVRRTLEPIGITLADLLRSEIAGELGRKLDEDGRDFLREYLEILVLRYNGSSRRQLQNIIDELAGQEEPLEVVERRLTEWGESTEGSPSRAEKEAHREANRMGNALSRHFFAAGGVTVLTWRAVGKNCPLCNSLDGKTVGIRERFASKGDTVEGEGANPQRLESDLLHPPLHQGCDCEIEAS